MAPDIKRILVPLDFSTNSELALDYAYGMARKFNADLHLVHVCEVPSMMTGSMDAYAIAYTGWSQQMGEQAERELEKLRPRLRGVNVSTEVLFGTPARAIVTCAGVNSVDLIVMGTHGHGAMMHMVMGNVAERVVRTADCPVLTVREKKLDEVDRKKGAAAAAASLMLVAGLLLAPAMTGVAAAQSADPAAGSQIKQTIAGAELFRTYCATCHGPAARGDGPLASSMTRKPPDLTELARRNGGAFPSELAFRTIDGKNPVRGHGGPDMPVWGDAFARSRDGGDENKVKQMIQSLVDYLESIQARVVHD
jgi:nucleotide-binding universal stress UspA family protein